MFNCINTDVCLPDYFSGDARTWICVPVHSKMSFKELREALHPWHFRITLWMTEVPLVQAGQSLV